MVVNNADLKLLLKRSFAFLPPSIAEEAMEAVDLMKPPSPSTLSRYQMVIDATFCRRWHARWLKLFSDGSEGKLFAIYATTDSSPQMGQDWEILEARIVSDPTATWRLMQRLQAFLPADRSKASLLQWSGSLTKEELNELQTLSSQLSSQVTTHVFTPTCLGSRHSSLAHKFHCMLHALKLDVGNWAAVRQWLANVEALTTDQGTERLLADVPTTWREVKRCGLVPAMTDVSTFQLSKFEGGTSMRPKPPNPAPPADDEAAAAGPAAEAEEPQAKKQRQHRHALAPDTIGLADTVIEIDSDQETDPDMPGLAEVDDEFPEFRDVLANTAVHDSERSVLDGDLCTHLGCSECVFAPCIHCGQGLCHKHIGPLSCQTASVAAESQSRCHEHLGIPVGQRSLVRSFFGLVRCPCSDCLQARDGLSCPCNATYCRGQIIYV